MAFIEEAGMLPAVRAGGFNSKMVLRFITMTSTRTLISLKNSRQGTAPLFKYSALTLTKFWRMKQNALALTCAIAMKLLL